VIKRPISKLIADRITPAYQHAGEFARTYRQLTPMLDQTIASIRELAKVMRTSADQGDTLADELEVIYGYAQEGRDIAEEHADEMAQLATLVTNLDVFLQGDPGMLTHVLRVADPAIMKEAAGKLDSKRLVLLQQALNEAVDEYKE